MDGIKVVERCHMGPEFKCEEIVDGQLVRCKQYMQVRGTDAQGREHDSWDCSFKWTTILMLDQNRERMSTTAAIDKLHNSLVIRQREAIKLVSDSQARLMDK